MLQIVEQTHEGKVKMYMKCTKRALVEMLLENQRIISIQFPVVVSPDPFEHSTCVNKLGSGNLDQITYFN